MELDLKNPKYITFNDKLISAYVQRPTDELLNMLLIHDVRNVLGPKYVWYIIAVCYGRTTKFGWQY